MQTFDLIPRIIQRDEFLVINFSIRRNSEITNEELFNVAACPWLHALVKTSNSAHRRTAKTRK